MSGPQLLTPAAVTAVALADLKAYLRLDHDGEDALLTDLVRAAARVAEDFTGLTLLTSTWRESFAGHQARYLRLSRAPAQAVLAVGVTPPGGSETVLAPADYALLWTDTRELVIDVNTVVSPQAAIRVDYTAGLTADINRLPEGLRHGLTRLVAHWFIHRDDDGPALPTAVAALWQPYRTLRLA
jgi:uncharacterized phiE125 gp8 family phage protein